MRGRTDQEGRGGLGLIVLIGVLAVGGYLAWGFVHQNASVPVVATSQASDTSAQVAGQSVPVTLVGVPVVTDNRVALDVRSTQVGSLPGPISDQLTQQLRQPLELGQPVTGFGQLRVAVTDGQLTVTGVAEPS